MSTCLPMNVRIVPAHVTQAYLNGYSEPERAKIAEIYEKVKEKALKEFTGRATPGESEFHLVAGSHGVGKSRLMERLKSNFPNGVVVCDADEIVKLFVSANNVRNAGLQAMADFHAANGNISNVREALEAETKRYMGAAEYIRDYLMTECVNLGIPVMMATNAKTPQIGNFLNKLKETGVRLVTHICEAPLRVKQEAASRKNRDYGIAVSPKQIKTEHDAMRTNLHTLASLSNELVIHWRQNVKAPLTTALVAQGKNYHVENQIAMAGLEAHLSDTTAPVSRLMDNRKPTSDSLPVLRQALAPAAT